MALVAAGLGRRGEGKRRTTEEPRACWHYHYGFRTSFYLGQTGGGTGQFCTASRPFLFLHLRALLLLPLFLALPPFLPLPANMTLHGSCVGADFMTYPTPDVATSLHLATPQAFSSRAFSSACHGTCLPTLYPLPALPPPACTDSAAFPNTFIVGLVTLYIAYFWPRACRLPSGFPSLAQPALCYIHMVACMPPHATTFMCAALLHTYTCVFCLFYHACWWDCILLAPPPVLFLPSLLNISPPHY